LGELFALLHWHVAIVQCPLKSPGVEASCRLRSTRSNSVISQILICYSSDVPDCFQTVFGLSCERFECVCEWV